MSRLQAELPYLAPTNFEQNGCCLIESVLQNSKITQLQAELEQLLASDASGVLRSRGKPYGVRNLLQLWPRVVEIASLPALRSFIENWLGDCGVVRALLFDKPPERSWTLPWHRDRTIAVREIPENLGEFSNPTYKAGIPHVIAPNSLLENMITLRLSLDPMTPENGPLVWLPGSHRCNNADDGDLALVNSASIQTLTCQTGDVFVMRPLLAHSSLNSSPQSLLRRRVVHIELCSIVELPHVQWYQYTPIPLR